MNLSCTEIIINSTFSIQLSFDINNVSNDWKKANGNEYYLSVPYLTALQNSNVANLTYIYVVVYNNAQPVGVVYFQKTQIGNSIFKQNKFPKNTKRLRSLILKYIPTNLLVCGNFFATGEYGYFFKNNQNTQILPHIINKVTKYLKSNTQKINFVLLKDFLPNQKTGLQKKIGEEYAKFQIDVNMILTIKPNWKSYNDYLLSMTTKYRTRAKSVFNKTQQLESVYFNADDILKYKNQIDTLFTKVLKTADFSITQPNAIAFYQLKLALKNLFIFRAYFYNQKLVAFSVANINHNSLDAIYVGIDYELNATIPLYQRLLYDYVHLAIHKNMQILQLGRTAELIKSNLGATPVNMDLYIKHTNAILHLILKPILKSVKPSWYELRNPFKRENNLKPRFVSLETDDYR